jgi:hypothetical protein
MGATKMEPHGIRRPAHEPVSVVPAFAPFPERLGTVQEKKRNRKRFAGHEPPPKAAMNFPRIRREG